MLFLDTYYLLFIFSFFWHFNVRYSKYGHRMKKYQIIKVDFLTFILVLYFCSIAFSEINKTTLQNVANEIKSIQTYHVKLKTKIFPPNASDLDPNSRDEFDPNSFMDVKSVVYGESGKRMKILTTIKSPELGADIKHMLIFDGTWLWVQQKINKHPQMKTNNLMISAMKIHIPSVSADPVNEPFNTIYGIAGIGLFRYKDLPGTFTELIEDYSLVNDTNKSNSKDIVFSGTKKPAKQNSKIGEVDKDLSEFMNMSTNYCKMWVSEKDGLIKAYSIGTSEKRPTMNTEIEYISINQKLPYDTFSYVPPEGVSVKDATANILKQKATGLNGGDHAFMFLYQN